MRAVQNTLRRRRRLLTRRPCQVALAHEPRLGTDSQRSHGDGKQQETKQHIFALHRSTFSILPIFKNEVLVLKRVGRRFVRRLNELFDFCNDLFFFNVRRAPPTKAFLRRRQWRYCSPCATHRLPRNESYSLEDDTVAPHPLERALSL